MPHWEYRDERLASASLVRMSQFGGTLQDQPGSTPGLSIDSLIAGSVRTTRMARHRSVADATMLNHPRITQALWWESLVTSAIRREWTVNLGQRNATERMAHLFCELFLRLRAVNLTSGNTCEFPVTQIELADATGLSAVHLNRTLQDFRAANLVELGERTLTIPDLSALMRASMFNTITCTSTTRGGISTQTSKGTPAATRRYQYGAT